MQKAILKDIKTAEKVISSLKKHSNDIENAIKLITECYRRGGKLILFGNGGSASDAQHIAAEFVGRFEKERKALPALALNVNTSVMTAVSNDYGYGAVFARQIEAFASPKDIIIALSTSGNSENVINAVKKAKEIGAKVIGFTGKKTSRLSKLSDLCFKVSCDSACRAQEGHITILHIICKLAEEQLYGHKKI